MVKPGGTGSAAFVISARPAPLPPSSSFILPLPSALPAPKKKTYCVPACGCMAALVSGLEIGVTLMWLVSHWNECRIAGPDLGRYVISLFYSVRTDQARA